MADEKSDHDLLIEVHAVLCGINGSPGLCKDFEKHKDNDSAFRKDYYNFKRLVIAVFCFLVGSGAIGFGVAEIIKLVK